MGLGLLENGVAVENPRRSNPNVILGAGIRLWHVERSARGASPKDPIRVSLAGDGAIGEELFAVPRSLDPYGSNERGGAHARIDRVESRFLTMQPSISTEAGAAGR